MDVVMCKDAERGKGRGERGCDTGKIVSPLQLTKGERRGTIRKEKLHHYEKVPC